MNKAVETRKGEGRVKTGRVGVRLTREACRGFSLVNEIVEQIHILNY